jgi:preprotein translocase SecF subunit
MFFRRLNWNVVGWFNIVSGISYAIIFAGIATMIFHWATTGSALRFGLSFTGGTDVTVKFARPAEKDAVTKALATLGVTDAQINTLTKPGEPVGERYTIETQRDFGNNSAPLWVALGSVATVDRAQSSISAVGPSLSHEYLFNAIKALVIAIGIQFVYIAFRFGWNYIFGLVTIVALLRDSAMMIGIYAMANKRVDDAFLAAVLTVIGYSVMDTIVILDRIRENTKLMAGEPFDKIVNTSILQTMTRSVNTLATVVITLVALLAFGGASLQNFAFALLVGICSGGYHSIFYSAPLVAVFQKRFGRAAALRRASLDQPRTVAEARAQAKSDVDRAEILAARKSRKERERQAALRASSTGPVRYRKRREESPAVGTVESEAELEAELDAELERGRELEAESQIDPLDAQNLGLHERDYELGHEAIRMDLDAVEAPPEPGAAPHQTPRG